MNFNLHKQIILASQSPRRQELLSILGIPFKSMTSDFDEKFESEPSDVKKYVTQLAVEKALSVAKKASDKVVIGSDTIVTYNGKVFPKPSSAKEAKEFLHELSGKTHTVMTAVAVINDGQLETILSETAVTFYELPDALIDAYVQTADPFDKAGAYGIQSGGALFVKKIDGDYYTVMGFPIAKLTKLLQGMGIISINQKEVTE